jgi:hypothetical protein
MDTMEAGREMDAEIGRRVFGLAVRTITQIDHRGAHDEPGYSDPPRRMGDGRMGVAAHALPLYSTDLGAAWQVVDKLRAEGHGEFQLSADPDPTDAWIASFSVPLGDAPPFFPMAPTAPLAICLAALAIRDHAGS